MKLLWDFKYFKISLYVLFTFAIAYLLKVIVDLSVYNITQFESPSNYIKLSFKYILSAFSPLILAFFLAYLLDPMVDFLQKVGSQFFGTRLNRSNLSNSRLIGTTLAFVLISLIIVAVCFMLVLKVNSSDDLVGNVYGLISKYMNEFSDTLIGLELYLISLGVHEYFVEHLVYFVNMFSRISQNFANSFLEIIFIAGGTIFNILIALVISFSFLKDKSVILLNLNKFANRFLSCKLNKIIRSTLINMNYAFSGYLRGQLIDTIIMAVLVSCLLSVLGVNFAIIVGIISGFANFIPFFGGIVSLVLSTAAALVSGDMILAIYAFIGVLLLQIIDGVFIAPKIVGKNVRLSPVLIILSLAIAGKLFGILGMFLTVPVCSFIKLCASKYLE